ncbi:hypothetical protein [Turicibacter sanguinis]|uniref:hypothetical protein n=1 Tax=Turicibacter sanguinis TaxID=154288 RepID=UPI0021D50C48|nr:hypothetical protein [Turicibacter sanguinis]MCU7192406.1 hypothetical protein [Turicibacter sanguinis]
MKKIIILFEKLSIITIPLFFVLIISSKYYPNFYKIFNFWYIEKNSEISTIISIFASAVITLYLTFPNQPTIKLALKKSYKKLMNFLELQIVLAVSFIFLLLIPINSTIIESLQICLTLAILWNFLIITLIIILARRSDETFISSEQKIDSIKEQTNRIETYVERINRKTH